ncbi:MAG: hypothetical protein QG622_3013 [Actinomycetota bacterium]|nr:hypothetical protein [Actinomycetota bacterium]
MLTRVSFASQPAERMDAIGTYLGHQGEGSLALALAAPAATPDGARAGSAVQRLTSSVLRGGLTSWVHVGMLVRRMRGRADPLQGLSQGETFQALCRLTQAAVGAEAIPAAIPGGLDVANHVQLFVTPLDADATLESLQRVLGPYAAAGTVTRTGRAVIAWFAIRHLIATRSRDYSLQVVHFTPDAGRGGQISLMLPRDLDEEAETARRRAAETAQVPAQGERATGGAPSATGASSAAGGQAAGEAPGGRSSRRRARRPRPAAPRPEPAVDTAGLQAYLDAYRDHLTRELLLEPVVSGSAAEFDWASEPTGDGGVAVAGVVPGVVAGHVVLRMAEDAMARLGERSPGSGGVRLTGPETDGDLLIQRWAVGSDGGYLLTVAARSGERRRPTQVLIHFTVTMPPEIVASPTDGAPADRAPADRAPADRASAEGAFADDASAVPRPPHEPPKTGPAAAEAATLTNLPLWWHDANARCDGVDVIIYEMPFRGRRLRVRANDYPAEAMYTLLVGEPGEEVAAVDLEQWPSCWTRPRST